jgi:hypothetical protein
MESLSGYHSFASATLPPEYGTVVSSWDGQWYWDVAVNGYPASARDALGQPQQTSLAFYPLYPMLVRVLMWVTGLDFPTAASGLSLLIGALATIVVFRLVASLLGRGRALAAVALLCCYPAAPIMQAAYTESLALLLVGVVLTLVVRGHYGWAILPVLLLGLTRNVSAVLAPVIALHWWVRYARPQRQLRAHPSWPPPSLVLLFLTTLAATALWPLLAGLITRDPDAYFTTMKAWPGYTSSPFDPPWLDAVAQHGIAAWLAALVLVGLFVRLVLSHEARSWGPELWGWTVSYATYIFLATGVTGSVIRYLLLCFPFALILAPPAVTTSERRSRNVVVSVFCLMGLAAQYVWTSKFLVYSGPQGGWSYP